MSQSKMLETRRRKQKSKKLLARMGKRAKKLRQHGAGMAGADVLKKQSP